MALDTSFPVELLSRTQYGPDNSGFEAFLQGRKERKEERRSKLEEQQATLNLLNISSQIQQRQVQNQWEIQDRALEMENRPKVANFLSNLAYGNFDQASESLKDASIPTSQLDEMTRALETARLNQEKKKSQERLLEAERSVSETLNTVTDWTDSGQVNSVYSTLQKYPEAMEKTLPFVERMTRNAEMAKARMAGIDIRQQNVDLRSAELEQKNSSEVKNRLGDMGYRAFQEHLSVIRGDWAKSPEDKTREIESAWEQAKTGMWSPVPPVSSPPSSVPTPAVDGTQQAPHRPGTRAMFDSIPSGEWFVNPKDGRVLQKR